MATDYYHANATAPVNLVTTNETTVMASTTVSEGYPRAIVSGHVNVTAGTGATGITIRIRQASSVGTILGLAETHTLAAGSTANIPFSFEDATGLLDTAAGNIYVITLQQVAATANGTFNSGDLKVEVPN